MQKKYLKSIFWILPLCLYSVDANAWGLFTHVYFAQSLLGALPLLDNRFRNAIKNFPELVMAGACLPDLAVISKKFKTTHQWQKAEYLISVADTEEEMAIAIGYASHLYVDVIAHNHFVPAHEAMWLNDSIFTHIGSEWAMDGHIAHKISHTPSQLLLKHTDVIMHFIAPCFGHHHTVVKRSLKRLAYADGLLRMVCLPKIINRWVQSMRNNKYQHFDYYIAKTEHALQEFHKVLSGHRPSWEPELDSRDVGHMLTWRVRCLEELIDDHAMPIHYYNGHKAKYILEH
ncbi:MAG: zinc dependent phospholipase C family protein [Methylophilaceae bacterium]